MQETYNHKTEYLLYKDVYPALSKEPEFRPPPPDPFYPFPGIFTDLAKYNKNNPTDMLALDFLSNLSEKDLQNADFYFYGKYAYNVFNKNYMQFLPRLHFIRADRKQYFLGALTVSLYSTADQLWKAMTEIYKPLENYNLLEEATDTGHEDKNNSTTKGTTTTTTDTPNTVTETSGTAENAANIYGFDTVSPDGVPADKTTSTQGAKTTQTGTDTTVQAIEGTDTDTGSADRKDTHRLTRSGNIGVTTSQQMLISEIDLRTKYNLIDIISKAIASEIFENFYI